MERQTDLEPQTLIEPDNMGRMNAPDGSAFITGLCGDTMEMYLVIENDTITEARFWTDGCNDSRLCGSEAARQVEGKRIDEALRISPAAVIDACGNLPGASIHCAILAVNTVLKAIADYLLRVRNS